MGVPLPQCVRSTIVTNNTSRMRIPHRRNNQLNFSPFSLYLSHLITPLQIRAALHARLTHMTINFVSLNAVRTRADGRAGGRAASRRAAAYAHRWEINFIQDRAARLMMPAARPVLLLLRAARGTAHDVRVTPPMPMPHST